MISLGTYFYRVAPFLLGLSLCVPGCGLKGKDPARHFMMDRDGQHYISDVPFYAQEKYQCGPASLAMVLSRTGIEVTPEELKDDVFTPQRKGAMQHDLIAATRKHGRLAYEIYGMKELLSEVAHDHPVIVLQNMGLQWFPQWHYSVAVGYDPNTETMILHSGTTKDMHQHIQTFYNTWERSRFWGLLVLKPSDVPHTARQSRYLKAVFGLEHAGKREEAAKGYTAALSHWPKSLAAAIGRGNCLYNLGKIKEAEKAFRKALLKHPESPELYNNLAHVLMERGRLHQARKAIQQAITLGEGQNTAYKHTLKQINDQSESTDSVNAQ